MQSLAGADFVATPWWEGGILAEYNLILSSRRGRGGEGRERSCQVV